MENLKRIGLLLIGAFTMATIYEAVLQSDSRDSQPLFIGYDFMDSIFIPTGKDPEKSLITPCKFDHSYCECYIEIPSSTSDSDILLTIFDNKINNNSMVPHYERNILTIVRGEGQKFQSMGNEIWIVGESGNVHNFFKSEGQRNRGIISFPLSSNNVVTIKDIIERHATGIDGICAKGQIKYPKADYKDYRGDTIF